MRKFQLVCCEINTSCQSCNKKFTVKMSNYDDELNAISVRGCVTLSTLYVYLLVANAKVTNGGTPNEIYDYCNGLQ